MGQVQSLFGPRSDPAERVLAEMAGAQHGVVARWQLLAAGITPRQIAGRVRRGSLIAIHPGVYSVGHTVLTRHGSWMAAVLAGGPHAMLSHRSAGALNGIVDHDPRLRIEITVPHARGGGRRLTGLVIHRSRLPMEDDLTVCDSIPVSSVERTLIDLACTSPSGFTRSALERADRLELLDLRALVRLRERARGRRGIRRIDPLLWRHRPMPFTRSELERRFLHLCDENGIARPAVNVPLEGHEVDCLWAQAGLVVELDGFSSHRGRASFEADRKRDARLQLAGYRVLRITWRRVVGQPAEVAEEVRTLLALGGWVKSDTP